MPSLPLSAVFLPLVVGLLLSWLRGRWESRAGWIALVTALVTTGLVGWAWGGLPLEEARSVVVPWAPSLGLDFVFLVDGLSVFFGLVVAGMGVLVVAYALAYFGDHGEDLGKFFGYLCLFLGAMLGTVFSGNLLQLFVFWELTGVASFLLIGFLHGKSESVRGARMALLTTGSGGLALLVGIVLVGRVFGTLDLETIGRMVATGEVGAEDRPLLTAAFLCVAVGIFTKSAQFPFHFWLPQAMAAPTPVSAYLHSATMVKLGVFLTARMLPVFHDLEAWTPVLVSFGFTTMLVGAVLAVLSHDLKAVLAYSTVSQLGLLVGHYGLFADGRFVTWDYVHLLNHVFYKASLFMVVGIIDHSAGTRDLRELGGLFWKMPATGVAAAIGLLAMLGFPLTTGFLSKEMLLKTAVDYWRVHEGWLAFFPIAAVLIGSTLKVTFSLGIFHRAFLGRTPEAVERDWHGPSWMFQAVPLFLSLCVLFFGVAAGLLGELAGVFHVRGIHGFPAPELHLWHGFTLELLMSAGIIVVGFLLYAMVGWAGWHRARVPLAAQWERAFDAVVDGLPRWGGRLVAVLGARHPSVYLPVVLGAVLVLGWWLLPDAVEASVGKGWGALPRSGDDWGRWATVACGLVACAALIFSRKLMAQLFALSVIGLAVTVYFALGHAPDLALTQILVESATLLLVVLLIFRLRRDQVHGAAPVQGWRSRVLRLAFAGAGGLLFSLVMPLFQREWGFEAAGDYYLRTSERLAKGTNAVNTILIDYRGVDTLLEITVLLIAALGCLGLLMRRRVGVQRQPPAEQKDLFPVPDNFILRSVVKVGFFGLNLFSLYLLLRGHNLPGGGFIAGLVTGLSLVLVGFTLGVGSTRKLLRVDGVIVASFGILLAAAVAVGPLAFGYPLLYQVHAYTVPLPLVGSVYVGTPFFFDLGVFLCVVGVVLKLVFPLMKSVHGLPAFVAEEEGRFASAEDEPIDVHPGVHLGPLEGREAP